MERVIQIIYDTEIEPWKRIEALLQAFVDNITIFGDSREEIIETTKKLIQVGIDRSSEGKTKYTQITRQKKNHPCVIVNNKNDNNIRINQYIFDHARIASNIPGH